MDVDGLGPRRGAQPLNVLHGAVRGSINGVAVEGEPRTNGFDSLLELGLDLPVRLRTHVEQKVAAAARYLD